jgi:hypothetical protein
MKSAPTVLNELRKLDNYEAAEPILAHGALKSQKSIYSTPQGADWSQTKFVRF